MTVPERLVKIREDAGVTRNQLAEELGRPYQTIANYETGKREPGHLYLIAIAKRFNVTVDYILGIEPQEKAKGPPPGGSGHSEKAERFIELFTRLSPEVQEHLIVLLADLQEAQDKQSGGLG